MNLKRLVLEHAHASHDSRARTILSLICRARTLCSPALQAAMRRRYAIARAIVAQCTGTHVRAAQCHALAALTPLLREKQNHAGAMRKRPPTQASTLCLTASNRARASVREPPPNDHPARTAAPTYSPHLQLFGSEGDLSYVPWRPDAPQHVRCQCV